MFYGKHDINAPPYFHSEEVCNICESLPQNDRQKVALASSGSEHVNSET